MKPLNNFTNIDKAKLLHELFPDQIPLILDNILAVCEDLQTNREAYAAQWQPGFFTFENWLMLAQQAEKLIKRNRKDLHRSSKIFSEQLFNIYDYTFLFFNDRICRYADVTDNGKLKLAILLLYLP